MTSTVQFQQSLDLKVEFDPLRPWLPGPPPARRQVPVEEVDDDYQKEHRTPLHVPVATMSLSSVLDLPKYNNTTDPLKPTYIFHGCGNKVTPALLESFSKWGPSVRFSRPRGYFSRSPAVYWTNSLAFAIGWCVFTETGQWLPDLDEQAKDFECVIYVSKADINTLDSPLGTCMLLSPKTESEEADLVDWCNKNVSKNAGKFRISPPTCTEADWSIIGSRIPKHTIEGLSTAMSNGTKLFGGADLSKIWIYAACDEVSSTSMANAGVEIIHITSRTDPRP